MDISKIKNLVKQNGDKFVFVENGEPEVVMMSFKEYEKLAEYNAHAQIHTNVASVDSEAYQAGFPEDDLKETEFMIASEVEFAGPPRNTTSAVAAGDIHEVAEVDMRGLPVRLEDIRLEDLPI